MWCVHGVTKKTNKPQLKEQAPEFTDNSKCWSLRRIDQISINNNTAMKQSLPMYLIIKKLAKP